VICPLLSRVEGLDELGSLQPDPSAGVPWIQGRFKVAAISWLRFTALKCSGRIQSTGSNVSIQSGWSSEFGRRPVDDQGQGLCYRLIPFVIRLILLWSGGAVGRFSRSSFFFYHFLLSLYLLSFYFSMYLPIPPPFLSHFFFIHLELSVDIGNAVGIKFPGDRFGNAGRWALTTPPGRSAKPWNPSTILWWVEGIAGHLAVESGVGISTGYATRPRARVA